MNTFTKYSLNLGGRLVVIDRPWVMGILNVTPDSFYDRSRAITEDDIARRATELLAQGADVIDVGGCSTRPGAETVTPDEEMRRVALGVAAVRRVAPQAIVSVDTFRADVARAAVTEWGASMVNDVGGGDLDAAMHATVAQLRVPYVVTHSRGTPATMQQLTAYDDVAADVLEALARKVDTLHQLGVNDVIADPGFGFAKTVDQNYRLLAALEAFHALDVPLLVGVSRKSMITRVLRCEPAEALNGTTVLHTVALLAGAHILRVHDVRAAVEARELVGRLRAAVSSCNQEQKI